MQPCIRKSRTITAHQGDTSDNFPFSYKREKDKIIDVFVGLFKKIHMLGS